MSFLQKKKELCIGLGYTGPRSFPHKKKKKKKKNGGEGSLRNRDGGSGSN